VTWAGLSLGDPFFPAAEGPVGPAQFRWPADPAQNGSGNALDEEGAGMERTAGRRRRVGVLSWGSNPLRRKVDRVEAGIFAGLLVTFLIGVPLLAVAAGWWEHSAAVAEQRAQRSVHLVTAVLAQDVPDIALGTGTWDGGALARWTASDGKSCAGVVLDTAGARAGSRLPIWVDGSCRRADPPLTRGAVRSRVIAAAALAPARPGKDRAAARLGHLRGGASGG
jgi:hypothetical protein